MLNASDAMSRMPCECFISPLLYVNGRGFLLEQKAIEANDQRDFFLIFAKIIRFNGFMLYALSFLLSFACRSRYFNSCLDSVNSPRTSGA